MNITYNSFNEPYVDGPVYGASNALTVIDGVFPTEAFGNGISTKGSGKVSITLTAEDDVYIDYFLVYGDGSCGYIVSVTYEDGTTQDVASATLGELTIAAFEIGATVRSIEISIPYSSNGQDYVLELAACTIE